MTTAGMWIGIRAIPTYATGSTPTPTPATLPIVRTEHMPLARWLRLLGMHPWHAHQLANSTIPLDSKCSALTYEYAWQAADRAGRTEIRAAIEDAEQLIHRYAHVWPAPRFCTTTLAAPAYARTWPLIVLPEGEIRALGPATESTATTVALTYTDRDGDGLDETATAVATVPSGTTADQVVCRFVAADCMDAQIAVAPRSVTISGTAATIMFDAWTLVRPIRYAGARAAPIDPDGADVLAASIAVLRQRADPSGTTADTAMAVLTWEAAPWPTWACCTDASDPAATATALARAVIRDARAGIVAFGEAAYDATSGVWAANASQCRPPDRITLRYQAGHALDGIQMQAGWATIVARLAAAELARPICACAGANQELYQWQKDLSQTGATDDLYAAPADITNPIGSRRGHVYAWRQIQQQQRLVGFAAG